MKVWVWLQAILWVYVILWLMLLTGAVNQLSDELSVLWEALDVLKKI